MIVSDISDSLCSRYKWQFDPHMNHPVKNFHKLEWQIVCRITRRESHLRNSKLRQAKAASIEMRYNWWRVAQRFPSARNIPTYPSRQLRRISKFNSARGLFLGGSLFGVDILRASRLAVLLWLSVIFPTNWHISGLRTRESRYLQLPIKKQNAPRRKTHRFKNYARIICCKKAHR